MLDRFTPTTGSRSLIDRRALAGRKLPRSNTYAIPRGSLNHMRQGQIVNQPHLTAAFGGTVGSQWPWLSWSLTRSSGQVG